MIIILGTIADKLVGKTPTSRPSDICVFLISLFHLVFFNNLVAKKQQFNLNCINAAVVYHFIRQRMCPGCLQSIQYYIQD